MSLSTGTRLGPYEILTPLGAGGMGEVYKARDTRLDRTVAIKVLPEHLSQKPQLRERFEREARAVSSLNHPNICTLHDVGQQDGIDYLVMEYLDGETLAARLHKGPLPLEQVLTHAIEIAAALDQAHRHGVIHRDLKPGNIMLTKSGVKVLDFGLAKIGAGLKPAPAATMTLTEEGSILGTLQYMAPEQLEGTEADARSDIFAFGAVVYEMATGKKAFEGKSRASVMAAILERQPPPLTTLDPMTPAALDRVVKKCLAKDPDRRWQSGQDLRDELQWIAEGGSLAGVPAPMPVGHGRGKWVWIAVAAVFAVIAGVFALAYFTRKPSEAAVTRFSFDPPVKTAFVQLAVSPDGRRVAFTGRTAKGGSALWLRSLDSFMLQELAGTEGASLPFWSPDGRFLGFTSAGKLKRMDVGGGQSSVQTITSTTVNIGASWSADGVVLFVPVLSGTGIDRVPSSGGTPAPATRLNQARQEISHRYPYFLPDGRHFLYWALSASEEYTGIYLGSVNASGNQDDRGPLVRTWRRAEYAPPGYLLFLQGTTLYAQRFDANKLRVVGDPQSLPDRISTGQGVTAQARFSVSPSGVLAYQEAAPLPGSHIVYLDRAGKQLREIAAPRGASGPSLAPDERRLVVAGINDRDMGDIWVIDLERGASSRLTASSGSNGSPIWSPDGRRILFRSNRAGVYDLYLKDAGGLSEEELIAKSEYFLAPSDWSRDGRFVIYIEANPKTRDDVWVLPLAGDRKPFPFLKTEFSESGGRLAPVPDSQGRQWISYISNETEQFEVYLQPFSGSASERIPGAKLRVSTGGGVNPQWRKDGRELFYVADAKLMAVDVRLDAPPQVGAPHALFELPLGFTGYVPLADGRRFLITAPLGEPPAAKINVVLNWQAELKR
jgi:Tol biopolymer transport system component/tRNA A-37 threonylcarbamoyl transferase component Bud32